MITPEEFFNGDKKTQTERLLSEAASWFSSDCEFKLEEYNDRYAISLRGGEWTSEIPFSTLDDCLCAAFFNCWCWRRSFRRREVPRE